MPYYVETGRSCPLIRRLWCLIMSKLAILAPQSWDFDALLCRNWPFSSLTTKLWCPIMSKLAVLVPNHETLMPYYVETGRSRPSSRDFDALLRRNWPFSPPNRQTLLITLVSKVFLNWRYSHWYPWHWWDDGFSELSSIRHEAKAAD
jgi:hypothetical protein